MLSVAYNQPPKNIKEDNMVAMKILMKKTMMVVLTVKAMILIRIMKMIFSIMKIYR